MDDIEINIQVTIPEWLRRKMGLTDEKTVPDRNKDELEEELRRLEDAIRRANDANVGPWIFRNVVRGEDRG